MMFARHPWALLGCLLCATGVVAQELEPRAYSPSPVGVNFLLVAGARSTGEVLTDPSVPLQDVEAKLNAGITGYGRTFGILGHQASAVIAVPYVWGDVSGRIFETAGSVSRSGVGDTRLRLAVNLIGGEALTPQEFMKRTPRTTLGASLSISAPTGQYDPTKLINIGTNRWAFKPEIGLTIPHGHWMFDVFAGVWLFSANPDFFGRVHREQDPMPTLQGHVSYTFRPRLWLALDSTYYFGGETSLDGVDANDRKENSRVGLTLSLPAGKRQSIKFNWSKGATARLGSNFTTFGVGWQYTWFD
ncbi:MAG TPA: transporter [Steroidobacteraceae bacterium]|nr:transporter [Steroidobacteraceae bacterium]